jgi:hypothetical protein
VNYNISIKKTHKKLNAKKNLKNVTHVLIYENGCKLIKDFIHVKDNKYLKHSSFNSLKNNMTSQISS